MSQLHIAGLDEVGRGCICGPVIAAAVILDPCKPLFGVTDSKKLSPKKRLLLAEQIKANAISWAIGRAEASEIEQINILQASLLAMSRAVSQLNMIPDLARVDGKHLPKLPCAGEAIVKGDLLFTEISAASILAKVARDIEMTFLERLFPGYGFAVHKGYPTAFHLAKLRELGISPYHRKTFAPVKPFLI